MDQSQHALLSRFPSTYDFNRPFSILMDLYYDLEDSVDAPSIPDENASPPASIVDEPADALGSPSLDEPADALGSPPLYETADVSGSALPEDKQEDVVVII
uniref:Uncharacterized protein n=1 Tax=Panagrolaimus sp. ES5 TaxID=591445 RepID=A0AC34G9S9_9BILA